MKRVFGATLSALLLIGLVAIGCSERETVIETDDGVVRTEVDTISTVDPTYTTTATSDTGMTSTSTDAMTDTSTTGSPKPATKT